jgi:hypothetical protein
LIIDDILEESLVGKTTIHLSATFRLDGHQAVDGFAAGPEIIRKSMGFLALTELRYRRFSDCVAMTSRIDMWATPIRLNCRVNGGWLAQP